jgi:hypothetical protein
LASNPIGCRDDDVVPLNLSLERRTWGITLEIVDTTNPSFPLGKCIRQKIMQEEMGTMYPSNSKAHFV